MTRARLFSPLGSTAGMAVDIDDEATIGRERTHTLVIDDGLISKDHAQISFDPDLNGFLLEDLGSTNGTALDGVPVVGRERLDHLHVITFASRHEFVFQDLIRTHARHGAARANAPVDQPTPPVVEGFAVENTEDAIPITEAVELAESHQPLAVPQALADRLRSPDDRDAGDTGAAKPVERTQYHQVMPAIPSGIGNLQTSPPTTPDAATPDAVSPDLVTPEAVAPELVTPEPDTDESPPLAAQPEPGSPSPFVLEVELDDGLHQFPLLFGSNQIGRTEAADVRLYSERVSRRHAVMKVGPVITVRDLGSSNHTFLEGEQIGGEISVEPGDRLTFGSLEARLLRVDMLGKESATGGTDEPR